MREHLVWSLAFVHLIFPSTHHWLAYCCKNCYNIILHPSLYESIVANNKLDLELYWFAVEEFEKRMRAIGKEIDTDTLHHYCHNHIITCTPLVHHV